jgi:hypothetical protein
MGLNIPSPTMGTNAPEVPDGLAVVRFADIRERFVESFVTDKDNYGKPDDGWRIDFVFNLLDEDGEIAYTEGGDPVEIKQSKACRRGNYGTRSNFREILGGILTAKEIAAWENSSEDDPFDGESIVGRLLDVKIAHNKRGWPEVETVVGIRKDRPKGEA